jgi:divalent metal cation (Fe/Co/Zn/Cd) transporter
MQADSRQTDFCTYLSAILLGGLLLNAVAEWWWADPVAGAPAANWPGGVWMSFMMASRFHRS